MDATAPLVAPPTAAGSRLLRVLRARLPGFLALIGFILLWQLVIVVFDPSPILFPGPVPVWQALMDAIADGSLLRDSINSFTALAIGLGSALAVGVPLGLWIGMSPTMNLITSPYLWAFFATPRLALAPLVIVWAGFELSKVWLVFLSAVIPVILSCKDGVLTTDSSLVTAARSFGAGRVALFAKVIAPSTLPFIASGIRNGISRGLVGLLVVEMLVSGREGIGTSAMRAMRAFDTPRMFAFVLVIIVAALVLISLSKRVESYASRWREEVAL